MKRSSLILIFFVALISTIDLSAQCAMCKAVVESNMESGSSVGKGLNTGILYLMSIPYLAIFLFGTVWYYQNKR